MRDECVESSKRLRDLREAHKLTQSDMASAAECSRLLDSTHSSRIIIHLLSYSLAEQSNLLNDVQCVINTQYLCLWAFFEVMEVMLMI